MRESIVSDLPAVRELAASETFAEPAFISRRVAEHDPDNLRVLIGKRTLSNLPNQVGNRRALIEEHENALALIMETGEGFGVTLAPGHHVDPPSAFVERIVGEQGGRSHLEQIASDEHAVPFTDLGPSFSFQLVFGVGCDNSFGILECRDCPKDNPRNQRRFANAVA
jgi:hypothetical protein